MPDTFLATVVVAGEPAELDAFRERVRHLMVRDIDAEPYTEHHAVGRLEFRFRLQKGIPFPAFAAASGEFPGLRVEVDWHNGPRGLRGSAVLQGGKLLEQQSAPLPPEDVAGEAQVDVRQTPSGELDLAFVCRQEADGALAGYAASAARHAYFRYSGGELAIEDAERASPDESLEALALEFASEWLWFDEGAPEDTAIERARCAGSGRQVRGANLKAARLAGLPFSTLRPHSHSQALRDAVLAALQGAGQDREPAPSAAPPS